MSEPGRSRAVNDEYLLLRRIFLCSSRLLQSKDLSARRYVYSIRVSRERAEVLQLLCAEYREKFWKHPTLERTDEPR